MDGLATPGLKSLPSDSRPREKLLARGPAALSDGELLALLLRSGIDRSRIREVSGKADTDPLIKENPSAAQNRRISITILTE